MVLRNVCTFLFFVTLSAVYGQGKNWIFAKSSISNLPAPYGNVSGNRVLSDSKGNVYVAGNFLDSDIAFDTTLLRNTGGINAQDVFILKYNLYGQLLWARQIAGAGNTQTESIADICLDARDNLLVLGNFNSRSLTLAGETFTNIYANNNDIFLCKMNEAGDFIWAKQYGGPATQNGNKIMADSTGDLYICGTFNGVNFKLGQISLPNTSGGNTDVFIARLDSLGEVKHAWSFGSTGNEYISDMLLKLNGDLMVSGSTGNLQLKIGSFTISNSSMFTVDFDRNGDPLALTGYGHGNINQLLQLKNGQIGLAGNYSGDSLRYGHLSVHAHPDYNNNGNAFILMLDSNKNALWLHALQGRGNHYNLNSFNGVTADALGNIYAAGYFYNSELSNNGQVYLNPSAYLYQQEMFLVKMDVNGNLKWHRHFPGIGGKYILGLGIDPYNDVLITGTYKSSYLAFDADFILKPYIAGSPEMFVAKLSSFASSVDQLKSRKQVVVYPNPATEEVHIQLPVDVPIQAIKVYRLSGELLLHIHLPEEEKQSNATCGISELPPGMYTIQIESDSQIFNSLFIKQ